MTTHTYDLTTRWTGNLGQGTATYEEYSRDYEILGDNKPPLAGSADPHFRGDPSRYNPEELLLAALSGCHLLWYLHLCADAGIVVHAYEDRPSGTMTLTSDGGGSFSEVVIRPQVTVETEQMVEEAVGLHARAHALCFIANSVSFPIRHEPNVTSAGHQ